MANRTVIKITDQIAERSKASREAYLARIYAAAWKGVQRGSMACANLAHAAAGCVADQANLKANAKPNIAIVTAYNGMLSAHQPFERFPAIIKAALRGASRADPRWRHYPARLRAWPAEGAGG